MDNERFIELAKKAIIEHTGLDCDENTRIVPVWLSKILLNNKAMFIVFPEMVYIEVTHDGLAGMLYLDVYRKHENIAVYIPDMKNKENTNE